MTANYATEVVRGMFREARRLIELELISDATLETLFFKTHNRQPTGAEELSDFRIRYVMDSKIKAGKVCELARQFAELTGVSAVFVGYYSRVIEGDEDDYKERKEARIIRDNADADYTAKWADYDSDRYNRGR